MPLFLSTVRPGLVRALALAGLLIFASPAAADTIRVPKDQPTIQQALFSVKSGDVVLVSSGTYEGTLDWFKISGVTLRAKGKVTLMLPQEASASTALLEVFDIRDIRLEGFRLVGNGSGVGVDLDNVQGLVLRNCSFRDLGTGVRTDGCRGLLLHDNDFRDVGTGMDLDGTQRSLVDRNDFRDIAGDAITGDVLREVSIRDNAIRGAGGGVDVTGASRQVRVTGNAVRDCDTGVSVLGTAVEVSGNTVKQCVDGVVLGGIFVPTTATAEGNRILDCSEVGLRAVVDSSVISGNRILRSGTVGLDLAGGSHLVEDNRIRQSGTRGVAIGESLVTLVRNTIRKSGTDDIHSTFGLSSVQLLDNDYGTLSTGF